MKASRLVSVTASILLAFSTVTADAGAPAPPPNTGNVNPVAVWVLFGCAAGIIIAALDASRRQHRELTPYEVATCGAAYWLTITLPH